MKTQARHNVASGQHSLKSWWSKKYNRPPNDPLFLNQSEAELWIEFYEDLYARKQEVEAQMDNGDLESDKGMPTLVAIDKALGINVKKTHDALVDKWEQEIEAGRIPDLNE